MAMAAVVDEVGARSIGQASASTAQSRTAAARPASGEDGFPTIATTGIWWVSAKASKP